MKARKITATTPAGTFTRKTARTYTHVVIGRQDLEAARTAAHTLSRNDINNAKKNFAYYSEQAALGVDGLRREHLAKWNYSKSDAEFQREYTNAKALADLGWDAYLETVRSRQIHNHLEAVNRGCYQISALNWCGRLGLAQKEAAKAQKRGFRDVAIYPVDAEA